MWPALRSSSTAARRAATLRSRGTRTSGWCGRERLEAVGGVEDVDAVQLQVHERLAGARPREPPGDAGTPER